ncbi:MAG: hypothetical protein H7Y37_12845 [Anaerolineae bacterium]|nr:hypothetical protein [Gloeobacterales cyanobacterium ES-bin-313]
MQIPFRTRVLKSYGADDLSLPELLKYNANPFHCGWLELPLDLPLPAEPHLSIWKSYREEAEQTSVFAVLKRYFIQFQFPILSGISSEVSYRAAVSQGVWPQEGRWPQGLMLEQPEVLKLLIHPSLAGEIPVLIAPHRRDFVSLVQALTRYNEPTTVPNSMGACMVAGFNNWDRIWRMHHAWCELPGENETWKQVWHQILPHKELYQDCFILLSEGSYSGIPAEALDLQPEDWLATSATIRLEHECTHYFTRRLFGSMRNNLFDEFLADYMGILSVSGRYRANWFLQFVGLAEFPAYRLGGRLENYRGKPSLSDPAFAILQALVFDAAHNLEYIEDHDRHTRKLPAFEKLLALSLLTIEELASQEAFRRFEQALSRVANCRQLKPKIDLHFAPHGE